MDNQLDQLAGREAKLTIRGHDLVVREVTMKHLKDFAAACGPFLAAFDEAGELAGRKDQAQDDFALFRVLAENGEAFMRATAMVTNAPVEFYEQLRPDEFFEVAAKVVEVNGDFFVRALAPTLIRFAKGVSLIGSMLLGDSSPRDTATGELFSTTSSVSSTGS